MAYWTHDSIIRFSKGEDPVKTIIAITQALVNDAISNGWSGPPFDPIELAGLLKIKVETNDFVRDARTLPYTGNKFKIEYNPNRPFGRIRFSLAHEIAHTLFEDCTERIRNRENLDHADGNDWQLEMLCNIGASEILMPIGSFGKLRNEPISVDYLMDMQKEYQVSTEALFLRAVRLTEKPLGIFVASRKEPTSSRYQIDYSVTSATLDNLIPTGFLVPQKSIVSECIAIGYTAKANESWIPNVNDTFIECVGIPPFPRHRYPRVIGLFGQNDYQVQPSRKINYLQGDATEPRGEGKRIIAHVVNDKAYNWGAGFGRFLKKKWPVVQREFRLWAQETSSWSTLGNIFRSEIDEDISVFSMVCQHGYGKSKKPRIRYQYLRDCLQKLAEYAESINASVHMPRIGCGEAGGKWEIVEELIYLTLIRNDTKVTIYDLPNNPPVKSIQSELSFDWS